MRALLLFVFAAIAACASAPARNDPASVDLTGADIAAWDSLSQTYAVGPVLLGMPMPLMPIPKTMFKTTVTAVCTVNEQGRITRISLTRPRDPEYGRKLVSEWRASLRFKPATTRDGAPTKGYYMIKFEF